MKELNDEEEGKLAIRAGIIQANGIMFLQGFVRETDQETKARFEQQRVHETNFKAGAICLDLYDIKTETLLDTITVSNLHYTHFLRDWAHVKRPSEAEENK